MKMHYTLECDQEFEFVVLAINSHCKAYKLCWNLNNALLLNFEMTDEHSITDELLFPRYKTITESGAQINLLANRTKRGYLIPSQKSVNYFLVIKDDFWCDKKESFLIKLRAINDILLVFELDLEKTKNSDRFIIHDKKN
jgi:hypothetical protein